MIPGNVEDILENTKMTQYRYLKQVLHPEHGMWGWNWVDADGVIDQSLRWRLHRKFAIVSAVQQGYWVDVDLDPVQAYKQIS